MDGMRCYQCARVCPGKALSVEYPGLPEDYRKFRDESADSPKEKQRTMITA
jgi:ferredoxin